MSGKRTLAALFAAGRLAFGLGLLARPERVASGWLGTDTERPTLKIALRGLGGRDVALSAGALASLGHEDRLSLWLAGAVLSDLSDVASTLAAHRDALPGNARWRTVALGGGSAAAGIALLAAMDR